MTGAGWHSGAVAFACALASAPAVAAICRRWTLYDFPGPLKIHKKPIPRLGGAGIAIALVLSIVIECHAPRNVILWLAAFGVIWLAGLLDDIRGLSPFLRLAAQICSGILLWSAGWSLPLGVPALLNIAAICGIVVVFVNAFNFLDGSDGLAAGVTAVIAGAYILAFGVHPDRLGLVVAWAVLGACLGFLERNLPPATIFMGDSGSTILGFCVAFLGIDFISRVPVPTRRLEMAIPAACRRAAARGRCCCCFQKTETRTLAIPRGPPPLLRSVASQRMVPTKDRAWKLRDHRSARGGGFVDHKIQIGASGYSALRSGGRHFAGKHRSNSIPRPGAGE